MVEDILAILQVRPVANLILNGKSAPHGFSSGLYGLRKYLTQINNAPELCSEPLKRS